MFAGRLKSTNSGSLPHYKSFQLLSAASHPEGFLLEDMNSCAILEDLDTDQDTERRDRHPLVELDW